MMRLRHMLEMSPSAQEIQDISLHDEVTFVPMDSIRDGKGGLDSSGTKLLSEVRAGSYSYIREGDVLLAKVTPCFENGKKALATDLVNGIGFATSEVHVLRPNTKKLDPSFLIYLLSSEDFRAEGMKSMTGAGGLRRVGENAVLNFRPAIADLPTQKRIAAFLDRETARIDELVAKKERLIEVVKEKRSSSLEHLVHSSGAQMNALRRVLNRIEQGWSPECESRTVEGDEWGVLKVGCVNDWQFKSDEHKALPGNLLPRPDLEISNGDILMSRANTPDLVGSVCMVQDAPPRLMLCDKLYRLRFNEALVRPAFAVMFLRSRKARDHYSSSSTGASSSMQNISQEIVRSLQIPLPTLEEQERRVGRFDGLKVLLSDTMQKTQTSIDRLREYRAALITAAVTGQIDVDSYGKSGTPSATLDRIEEEMQG